MNLIARLKALANRLLPRASFARSVGVLAGLTAVWPRHLPHWPLIVVLGIIGTVMPTWFYFQVRPLVTNAVGVEIGVGMGVWLNGAGHLLLAAATWVENRGRY